MNQKVHFEKEIKDLLKIVPAAMDYSFKAGKKLLAVSTSATKAEYSFNNAYNGLSTLLNDKVKPLVSKAQREVIEEEGKVEHWQRNDGAALEVNSHQEAKIITKFSYYDPFVWILFIGEGYFGFSLMQEYYADPSTMNLVKSLVAAALILLITAGIKKYAYNLPRFFKHIIAFVFIVSASAFIYLLSDLRKDDSAIGGKEFDSPEIHKSIEVGFGSVENADRVESFDQEFYYSLSLLLTLMFGGLTVSFALRDPKLEHDAQKIVSANKDLIWERSCLSYYELLSIDVSKEVERLSKKGLSGTKVEALARYMEGVQKCQSNSHLAASKEEEVKAIIARLK